jgi:hypothetical protein
MPLAVSRPAIVALLSLALAACVASGTTQLVSQWKSPEFKGPPLERVFVIAATADQLTRRVLEDAVVADLTARDASGIPSYRYLPDAKPATPAQLKSAIAAAGVDGVLFARVETVAQQVRVVPGSVVPVYVGIGWDSFYNFYNANYIGNYVQPPEVSVTQKLLVETRLFATRGSVLVWSATTRTPIGGSTTIEERVERYAALIVQALAEDGILPTR